jgi:hypothetical protein
MGVADEKLQPLLPGQLPTELLVLCHACCDFDPDMRPSFATLVEELEGAVATLQVRCCGCLEFGMNDFKLILVA